jgi:pyridoxamine 5'-phosphate oxidase
VALLFPWYAMERQVKIIGSASKVSESESDGYFATRPWSSQIGAWASNQSSPLKSRAELQDRFEEFAKKYPEGTKVPRPTNWGGYLVAPESIEFWQGRYSRLHDRIRYLRIGRDWKIERLYP